MRVLKIHEEGETLSVEASLYRISVLRNYESHGKNSEIFLNWISSAPPFTSFHELDKTRSPTQDMRSKLLNLWSPANNGAQTRHNGTVFS
jgi:hypothetical protein